MSPPLMDIYEEHLNEASFLWSQWERAFMAPDYGLEDTAALEERLLAHLDGLVLGGETVARALLLPALDSRDPPLMSAALWALLAEPGWVELAVLLERSKASVRAFSTALGRAMELSERREIDEALRASLKGEEWHVLSWAIGVLAFRGQLPQGSEVELLGHPDAEVVISLLRGVQSLPPDVASRELPRLLEDSRPGVRQAAIEAGMRSGAREAWEACGEAVEARAEVGRGALVLFALGGRERDLERLLACTRVAPMCEDALWALGFSGRLEAADECVALMRYKPIAALAGEAFCAITGLRLEGAYSTTEADEESLPPLEDDLLRDLRPRPEHGLVIPSWNAVAAWWKESRRNFSPGTRYLRGRVFGMDGLVEELARGSMRRRHVHALELTLRSQGTSQLQTRTFIQKQREQLERLLARGSRPVTTPFWPGPGA